MFEGQGKQGPIGKRCTAHHVSVDQEYDFQEAMLPPTLPLGMFVQAPWTYGQFVNHLPPKTGSVFFAPIPVDVPRMASVLSTQNLRGKPQDLVTQNGQRLTREDWRSHGVFLAGAATGRLDASSVTTQTPGPTASLSAFDLMEPEAESVSAAHESTSQPRSNQALSSPPLLRTPAECNSGAASIGSVSHDSGLCKPCSWFSKPQGCRNGANCRHCHTCPESALRRFKRGAAYKRRAAMDADSNMMIRMATIQTPPMSKLHDDPSLPRPGLIFEL